MHVSHPYITLFKHRRKDLLVKICTSYVPCVISANVHMVYIYIYLHNPISVLTSMHMILQCTYRYVHPHLHVHVHVYRQHEMHISRLFSNLSLVGTIYIQTCIYSYTSKCHGISYMYICIGSGELQVYIPLFVLCKYFIILLLFLFPHMLCLAPLTDERAQQIIDKALESSSLPMRNVVAVLTGLMGSGKTWFLARLFNQKPPDLYTSTGIAEQSCRGLLHRIGNISLESWELFSPRKVLEYLACHFHEDLPPANVAELAAKIATLGVQADPAPTSTSSSSSTPPPLPSTPASASASVPKASSKPPTPPTKSDTSQSMVRLVKAPQGSKSLAMLELVHMIDTGGQPEFMENMPSLVYHCHLALLILNLMFGLDEYPAIHYHEKGKAYKRALPSRYSNRQIIQKLASTLQAKRFSRKESQCFRLLVVATHRDCVPRGELAARVKAFNQALESILLPACEEELITCSAGEIPFVLNLKEPDSTDLTKLALIREKVSESGVGEVVETPSSFLIFEQELVEFAKKVAGKDILSLEQCLQVGSKLKMESEVVKAALIFFHRQITLLYFRYVLPNVVFAKPQVPLDFINSIVQFSYKVASGETWCITPKLASPLRDGIITEENLSHNILKKCFIADLYEARHAIDLLCHTFTLAPLSCAPQLKTGSSPAVKPTPSTPIKREKREYLMMSLRPAIPDKDIPQYIPPPSEIAPLVVKFSKDCVPLSCFSSTISCLLSMYDWRLSRADNGSPECLAHNVVSLFKPQTPGQIVLVDVGHSFQIHINADKDTDRMDFPEICFQVKETIFTAIGQVFDRLNLTGIEVSPAFTCPCSGEELFPEHKPSEEDVSGKQTSPREPCTHSASAYLFKNKWFLHCSKTEKSVGAALEKHKMWLDTPVAEKEKPSLPKLYELEVPEKAGAQYEVFGMILLNDDDGSLIEAIEVDCQGKCERIVRKTLTQWIRGRGKPVTWTTLIETLQRCKLNAFADHIRQKTQ